MELAFFSCECMELKNNMMTASITGSMTSCQGADSFTHCCLCTIRAKVKKQKESLCYYEKSFDLIRPFRGFHRPYFENHGRVPSGCHGKQDNSGAYILMMEDR